jgi:hypothetical protein
MSQNHVAHASNQSQNERVSGDPSISIAPVQHRLHIGGQAEPFLPGRKLSVCCSALQPGRQVRHQLIHELKAAEVLFFAFVESLRGSSPGDSIGFCVVRNLFSACSSPHNVLTRELPGQIHPESGLNYRC